MLAIRLFGHPELTLDGRQVKIVRRKSRALLFYLAGHTELLTRDHLLANFWPETERHSAQQSLRSSLYELRKVVGSFLESQGERVGLSAGVSVDLREFESLLAESENQPEALERALQLYRGEFLEGFSLPDSSVFTDWLVVEQERYRQLVIRALIDLSRYYESKEDYARALEALDRALQFNPLQEDLQRQAIWLHYLSGDRPSAISRYDRLRRLLDEEMGVPPMAETRSLYDSILSEKSILVESQTKSSQPKTTRTDQNLPPLLPFRGRSQEIKRLRETVLTHRLVLVEGEAGIGKTRLVNEYLLASDSIQLIGNGRELDQALPFQPLIEALRGLTRRPDWSALLAQLQAQLAEVWLAEASRLLPELSPEHSADPHPAHTADESRLWEGINQLLATLARQKTVVLFLDDLHWADASTLALFGYLVRQKRTGSLHFLAATRPFNQRTPLATLIQTLTREERLARILLARLDQTAVQSIVHNLGPDGSESLASWLYQSSEGNPFILNELLRSLREKSVLAPGKTVDQEALSASPILPQSVYSLIQARLEKLSESARRILDAAVAAGREFDYQVVAQASGLSESFALDGIDELRAAGIVRVLAGWRFEFDHSLTMEVAYREVGEPRHRLLHRRVAEALENLNQERLEAVSGLVAWHFLEANEFGQAAPYAYQAGLKAAGLAAWSEAIAFLEQALLGITGADRLPVLLSLGRTRQSSGQVAQASEAYREALGLALQRNDQQQVNEIRLALAQSLLAQSRFAEAIEQVKNVCTYGSAEHALKAEMVWGTILSVEGSDLEEAAGHLRAAETLFPADPSGDLLDLAQIKFELGSLAAQQGDLPAAVDLYRQSLLLASESEGDLSAWQQILAHNNLAYHLHLMDEPGAREHALAGLKLAEEIGNLGLLPYLYSTLGEIALANQEVDRAEEYFQKGFDYASSLAIPERIAGITANLGLVALQQGETPLAIHRLSKALGQADALGTHHLATQIRIWLAPLLPQEAARERLAEARATAEKSGRKLLLANIERLEAALEG